MCEIWSYCLSYFIAIKHFRCRTTIHIDIFISFYIFRIDFLECFRISTIYRCHFTTIIKISDDCIGVDNSSYSLGITNSISTLPSYF